MRNRRWVLTGVLAAVIWMACGITMLCSAAIVDSADTAYSYKDMKEDIAQLTKQYPKILTARTFGQSLDERDLYCLYLGNRHADKQIFVTADMHAREYLNGQVVMNCVEYYCRNYEKGSYDGVSYKSLFNKVCFVIMPMVNPDGVAIATGGTEMIRNPSLRKALEEIEGGVGSWQANARGVDINRNWGIWKDGPGDSQYSDEPAYEYYGGVTIYSEAETRAVRRAIHTCSDIQAFVCFHSMGRIIYWGYANDRYEQECVALANAVKKLNGYTLVDESASEYDHGDFEHYIIKKYRKPYVCIETGSGIPVPSSEYTEIYNEHRDLFAMLAKMYR